MLSCDPAILRAYKRVIDEGFRTTMREGLALERRENRERSGRVTADDIRGRRAVVQARGRAQTRDA